MGGVPEGDFTGRRGEGGSAVERIHPPRVAKPNAAKHSFDALGLRPNLADHGLRIVGQERSENRPLREQPFDELLVFLPESDGLGVCYFSELASDCAPKARSAIRAE